MGSSSKSVTTGYRYYMGLHFGLCYEADEVQRITVDEKVAWSGQVTENAVITINKPNLFGGEEKEGGISGDLSLLFGKPEQAQDTYLQSKLGNDIPAFRNLVSAVFRGGLVSANNPYVKPWAFRVKKVLSGWKDDTPWFPEAAEITESQYSGFQAEQTALGHSTSYIVTTSPTANVHIAVNPLSGILAAHISNKVYYSTDVGLTWQEAYTMTPTVAPGYVISTYDNFGYSSTLGFYVWFLQYDTVNAVGSTVMVTSEDGITWTAAGIANDAPAQTPFVEELGIFIGSNAGAGFLCKYSTDGLVWHNSTTALVDTHFHYGCWSPQHNKYLGLFTQWQLGVGDVPFLAFTEDGDAWTNITFVPWLPIRPIAFHRTAGKFMTYYLGDHYSSSDGLNWTGTTCYTQTYNFIDVLRKLEWNSDLNALVGVADSGTLGRTTAFVAPTEFTRAGLYANSMVNGPYGTYYDTGNDFAWIDSTLLVVGVQGAAVRRWRWLGGIGTGDMNPAHIVYQCITNSTWGMGYPISAIDDDSFRAVAEALAFERFGLSFYWSRQESIENFLEMVLEHILGVLYRDPNTGKFKLKLVRDDYVKNDLNLYDQNDIIEVTEYQRKLWGETVNEVTVVYTESTTEKQASVTEQDIANIQTQGAVVAQTINFPGIRKQELAIRVARRELNARVLPTASIKFKINRRFWAERPGNAFRLSFPQKEINDVVFRVVETRRGNLLRNEIEVTATEDVYGMETTLATGQGTLWDDGTNPPADVSSLLAYEAPYWDLVRNMSAADLDYLEDDVGFLVIAAAPPSNDAQNFQVYKRNPPADYTYQGMGDFCPNTITTDAYGKNDTIIAFNLASADDVTAVSTDTYAYWEDEIIAIKDIDNTLGQLTIARGILDTVPKEHSAGTTIWFAEEFITPTTTEHVDGELVNFKLLTRTSQGLLDLGEATEQSFTFGQRMFRPYPPGNFLVNLASHPEYIDGNDLIDISWAHRDRLLQTAYLVEQDEADIGPEPGVTYTLQLYGEDDTLIINLTGLTTTAYNWTTEVVDSGLGRLNGIVRVILMSVRSGLESYQSQEHLIRREGYGFGYGYFYGGN